MLDGRRCSNSTEAIQEETVDESVETKDVVKDDRGNTMETASTVSSHTAASSIAKSMDIIPHSNHSRAHLQRSQPKDYEKYRNARVGAAAVLYNHFNVSTVSDKKVTDVKNDHVLHSDGNEHVNGKGVDSVIHKGQSSSYRIGTLAVPSINKDQEPLQRSESGRSKVTPKSATYDDDELKINGLSLSEMVRMSPTKKNLDDRDDDPWKWYSKFKKKAPGEKVINDGFVKIKLSALTSPQYLAMK